MNAHVLAALHQSMQRLVDGGLIEKRDLEPGSFRGRYDWRLSDDGWRLLRITGLMTLADHLAVLFEEEDRGACPQ